MTRAASKTRKIIKDLKESFPDKELLFIRCDTYGHVAVLNSCLCVALDYTPKPKEVSDIVSPAHFSAWTSHLKEGDLIHGPLMFLASIIWFSRAEDEESKFAYLFEGLRKTDEGKQELVQIGFRRAYLEWLEKYATRFTMRPDRLTSLHQFHNPDTGFKAWLLPCIRNQPLHRMVKLGANDDASD